jgi:hypothetical protein
MAATAAFLYFSHPEPGLTERGNVKNAKNGTK